MTYYSDRTQAKAILILMALIFLLFCALSAKGQDTLDCDECLGVILGEAVEEYDRVETYGPMPISAPEPVVDCSRPKAPLPASDCSRPVRAKVQTCPDCGRSDCWRVSGEPQYVQEPQREEISAGAAIGIIGLLVKILGCCK